MGLNAQRYKINDFPKNLKSLEITNPCKKQIQKDLKTVLSFNSHPAFQYINRINN
tara:strand:- start:20 stop:184 length:165 start_codon:yes stop_codon:yes gene_type:complete